MSGARIKVGDRVRVAQEQRERVGEPASGVAVETGPWVCEDMLLDDGSTHTVDRDAVCVRMDWPWPSRHIWFRREELVRESWLRRWWRLLRHPAFRTRWRCRKMRGAGT